MSGIKVRVGSRWLTIFDTQQLGDLKTEMDKNKSELQDEIDEAIDNVEQTFDDLDEYLEGAFKDGIISYAEKAKIESYLNLISVYNSELMAKYTELMNDPNLSEDRRELLEATKQKYDVQYNALTTTIINVIEDNKATQEEILNVDLAFEDFDKAMAIFVTQMEQASKDIYEKRLADEKEAINKNMGELSDTLNDSINDVQNNLENFEDEVNTTFRDGVITEAEKISLEKYLQALDKSHIKLLAEYTEITSSAYMTQQVKADLDVKKNSYVTAYESLVSTIRHAIDDNKISDLESEATKQVFDAYDNALDEFVRALKKANSLSTSEEIRNNREELEESIDGVQDNLDTFEEYVDGAFKDNLIDEMEARNIATYIQMLETSSAILESEYNNILSHSFYPSIPEKDRADLESSYLTYKTALGELTTTINNAILDGYVTAEELADVNREFDEFQTALDDFSAFLRIVASLVYSAEIDTAIGNLSASVDSMIEDLTQDIVDFEKYIENAFKDGIITEIEMQRLETYIDLIESDHVTVRAQYNALMNDEYLPQQDKDELAEAYGKYMNIYDSLILILTRVISDQVITSEEKDQIEELFEQYKERLEKLIEEFQTASAIIAREKLNLAVGNLSEEVNESIDNVKDSVNDLETYIDGAFKDGVISSQESRYIEGYKQVLITNNTILEAQYNDMIQSIYLPTNDKNELETAHDNYTVKLNALLKMIDDAVEDGKATTQEANAINQAFDEYNELLSIYVQELQTASAIIFTKQVEEAENNINKYLKDELEITNSWISDVESEVTRLDDELGERVTHVELNEYWATHQGIDTSYATTTVNDMKDKFNNMEEAMQTVHDYVQSAGYVDGVLYDVELNELKEHIENTKKPLANVENLYTTISNSPELDTTTEKGILDSAYGEYLNYYNTYISILEKAMEDQKITSDEQIAIDNAFADYQYAEKLMEASLETAILKVAEVKAVGSKEEAKKFEDEIVSTTNKQTEEARDLIRTITNFITNAFSNGHLGEDEKTQLGIYLDQLETVYNSLTTQAQSLLDNDLLLVCNERMLLQQALTNVQINYGEFIGKIDTATQNSAVTSTQATEIDGEGEELRIHIASLERAMILSASYIANNMVQGVKDTAEYWAEIKKQEAQDYADELKEGIDKTIDNTQDMIADTSDALQKFKDSSSIQSLGQTQLQSYLTSLGTLKGSFDLVRDNILENYSGDTTAFKNEYAEFENDYKDIVAEIGKLLGEGALLDLVTFNKVDQMLKDFNGSIDDVIVLLTTYSDSVINNGSTATANQMINEIKKYLGVSGTSTTESTYNSIYDYLVAESKIRNITTADLTNSTEKLNKYKSLINAYLTELRKCYPNEVNFYNDTNCYIVPSYNASFDITSEKDVIVTVNGVWARVGLVVNSLEKNTTYTMHVDITNPNSLKCGLHASKSYPNGFTIPNDFSQYNTTNSFSLVQNITTDGDGILYVELYANSTDTATSGTVTYKNITLWKKDSDFFEYRDGISTRYNYVEQNFPKNGSKYSYEDFKAYCNYVGYLHGYVEMLEDHVEEEYKNYWNTTIESTTNRITKTIENSNNALTFFNTLLKDTDSIIATADSNNNVTAVYHSYYKDNNTKIDNNATLLRNCVSELLTVGNVYWTSVPSNVATLNTALNSFNTAFNTLKTNIGTFNTTPNLTNANNVKTALNTVITHTNSVSSAIGTIAETLKANFISYTQGKLNDISLAYPSLAEFSNVYKNTITINSQDGDTANITFGSQYSGIGWKASDLGVTASKEYIFKFRVRKTDGTLERVGGHADTSTFATYKLMYFDGVDVSSQNINMTNSYTNDVLDDGRFHSFVCKVVTSGTITASNLIYIQPNRGLTTSVTVDITDIVFELATEGATNFINYSYRLRTYLEQLESALWTMFNSVCISDVTTVKTNIDTLKTLINELDAKKHVVMDNKYLSEEYAIAIYDDMEDIKIKVNEFIKGVENVIADSVILPSEISGLTTVKNNLVTSHDEFSDDMLNAINNIKGGIISTMTDLSLQLTQLKDGFNEDIVKTIKSLASYLDSSIKIRTELAKLQGYITSYELMQTDLLARYNQIYYNSYLTTEYKGKLSEQKTLLETTFKSVTDLINKAIENNHINDAEMESIEYAMSDYKVQVKLMSELLEECVDVIANQKITGVQVGGRNLLINSTFNNGLWNNTGWILIEDEFSNSAKADQKGRLSDNEMTMISNRFILYPEDTYFTFSLSMKVYDFEKWDKKLAFKILFYGGDNHNTVVQAKDVYLSDCGLVTMTENQWYRLFYTCKLGDSKTLNIMNKDIKPTRGAMGLSLLRNGTIEVKECKVERSSLPSEWSPAPEDDYSAILSLVGRVTDVQQLVTEDAIINMVTSSDQFNFAFEGKVTLDDLKYYITSEEARNQFDAIDNRFNALDYVSEAVMNSKLEQTRSEITANFTNGGGVNLIKNSVGYDGTTYWTVSNASNVKTVKGTVELEQKGAGCGFLLTASSTIKQDFYHWIGTYRVAVRVDKSANSGAGYIKVIDPSAGTKTVNITNSKEYDFEEISIVMEGSSSLSATIEIGCTSGSMVVTSIIAHFGGNPLQWTHATGELYNDNVILNRNGIKVTSSSTKSYTSITTEEFAGYAEVLNENNGKVEVQKVFCLNNDVTEVNKLQARKYIEIPPVQIIGVPNRGIAFIGME